MGLRTDLNLKGDEYQWLSSMFYFGRSRACSERYGDGSLQCAGYLAWEYPTNRLLQRLPLAKYSSFCVIMWGLVLACFAGVKSYSGAIAIRFFLGVFEAAVTPGFAYFTSQVRHTAAEWIGPI